MQNTDERIKKIKCLDIIQYYPAIRKDQTTKYFLATGKKVEVIILREAGETEQDKNHMVSLLGGLLKWRQINFLPKRNGFTDLWFPRRNLQFLRRKRGGQGEK